MVKPKIFVSYSSKDEKEAENLVAYLRSLKVEVIIDKDFMRPPNSIAGMLREQIRISDGCVWVLTENSLKSQWCPVELGAFWGAGKPVIIYNPTGKIFEPFSDIVHAAGYPQIKEALKRWELSDKTLATATVQDIEKLIEKSVKSAAHGLSDEVRRLREHLPVLTRMMDFVEAQNTFLQDHAALLSKITEIIKRRGPKKITCAFDVPSFGSVSAQSEYSKCRDAFDTYVAEDEWELTLYLLPVDVGRKIVNTEFRRLQRRKEAWEKDIRALKRFRRYAKREEEGSRRKFSIGWLAVNRDHSGDPIGLHSMPLSIWVFDDSEAVFSTAISNYKPTSTNATDTVSHKEMGFSTTDREMVRFLGAIIEKYASNIDDKITLEGQIAASQAEKSRIERSIPAQNKIDDVEE